MEVRATSLVYGVEDDDGYTSLPDNPRSSRYAQSSYDRADDKWRAGTFLYRLCSLKIVGVGLRDLGRVGATMQASCAR